MFTKAETARVKGIGILLLLFHHLFYNVDFVEKTKMEFLFLSEDRIQPVAVMERVCVWLFVFLSAYGLSLQYQKRGGANSESTLQFLIRRWFSLMKAFWPVYVFVFFGYWCLAQIIVLLIPLIDSLCERLGMAVVPIGFLLPQFIPDSIHSKYGGSYLNYFLVILLAAACAKGDVLNN